MLLLFFGIFWGMYLCTFYVGEVFCFFFLVEGQRWGLGGKNFLKIALFSFTLVHCIIHSMLLVGMQCKKKSLLNF